MGTTPETPTLDLLHSKRAEYNALMEFVEEFLPEQRVSLYRWTTGVTDLRPCSGPRGGLMDLCPNKQDPTRDCPKCLNTGVYEIDLDDRDLPYRGNKQDLVYQFLGIDPQMVEQERRAVLEAIR